MKDNLWSSWMKKALQLASLSQGLTSPNPSVGAIILDSSYRIIGEGFHSRSGSNHAEIEALIQARDQAKDGTLIVTLEPCCHTGKTPPCTEAIIKAGIKRVVIAIKDPDPRVSGSGIKILEKAGIEVITGILKEEALYQNRAYIFRVNNHRPWGILKWAMSCDGRIALPNNNSKWISNTNSRNWVHSLRAKSDAVIIGGETARKDNPLLTSRGIKRPEPIRVVFSKNLEFPEHLHLWETSIAKTFIAFSENEPSSVVKKLPTEPQKIILKNSSPKGLLEALADKGCNQVLWECGGNLSTQAIKEGCVQEIFIVLAPKLLGGIPANSPLTNFGFESMDQVLNLSPKAITKLEDDLVLQMSIPNPKN